MKPVSRRELLRIGAVGVVAASCGPGGAAGDDDTVEPPSNPAFAVPRITGNAEFYVVSYAGTPAVDAGAWRLAIDGLVSANVELSLADIEAMGLRDKEHTLQCIGSSPFNLDIGNAVWSGLPLLELLANAGVAVDGAATFMQLRSADAYLNQLERADLDADRIWLVTRMNGAPLPPEHGFPARLLVNGRYGFKNPKWIERITFASEPVVGTWQELGYPDDGSNRPAGFVHLPAPAQQLARAPVDLVGCAHCGDIPITSVELSQDEGATWAPAELVVSGVPNVWTLWKLPFTPPAPGVYAFLVRVRAEDGRASLPQQPDDNGGWQGYGSVSFTVA